MGRQISSFQAAYNVLYRLTVTEGKEATKPEIAREIGNFEDALLKELKEGRLKSEFFADYAGTADPLSAVEKFNFAFERNKERKTYTLLRTSEEYFERINSTLDKDIQRAIRRYVDTRKVA